MRDRITALKIDESTLLLAKVVRHREAGLTTTQDRNLDVVTCSLFSRTDSFADGSFADMRSFHAPQAVVLQSRGALHDNPRQARSNHELRPRASSNRSSGLEAHEVCDLAFEKARPSSESMQRRVMI
jgi:hypothetical protein